MTDSLRTSIQVRAGVIPGTTEPEHTRQWTISSQHWDNLEANPGKQAEALAKLAGQAFGYAQLLTLQPDRFNWVQVDWLWY